MEKATSKMSRLDRAKQFAPFTALRGFGGVIKTREVIKADKPELSEDDCAEISSVLSELKKGDVVDVKYYEDGFIISLSGAVTYLDTAYRILRIIKTEIRFCDLIKINFSEKNDD